MKKILTAVAISAALTLSVAAPAQAARDGETGYRLGCMIMWLTGHMELCQEIQV